MSNLLIAEWRIFLFQQSDEDFNTQHYDKYLSLSASSVSEQVDRNQGQKCVSISLRFSKFLVQICDYGQHLRLIWNTMQIFYLPK